MQLLALTSDQKQGTRIKGSAGHGDTTQDMPHVPLHSFATRGSPFQSGRSEKTVRYVLL